MMPSLSVWPMLQVDMDFKVVEAVALVAAEGAIEASGIDVSSLALSVGHVKNVVHRIVEPAKASDLITNQHIVFNILALSHLMVSLN